MASACDPWFRYVACGTSPPVYPTRVLTTPGSLRIRSCMPQKQPPANTARSSLLVITSPPSFPLPDHPPLVARRTLAMLDLGDDQLVPSGWVSTMVQESPSALANTWSSLPLSA